MILILKLLLTPILIALATLAGRRWGPAMSGWLTGFPLTSGPVSIILALQHGSSFAAQAAVGNLAGLSSISVFCLAYSLAARKWNAWISLASGIAAYLVATAVWNRFSSGLWPTVAVSLAINGAVIGLIPRSSTPIPSAPPSRWDIPLRMCVAAVFVFTLTTSAAFLGPHLSGLLTPFPLFCSILATFAHRQQGAGAARSFLRGHAISLFGFAAFFIVVGGLLTNMVPIWAYLLAILATMAVNGISLRITA
jgi:hypothetical protein